MDNPIVENTGSVKPSNSKQLKPADLDNILLSGSLSNNGLAANGLATNGLAVNGLAANGLAANGLATNGLAANGLAANGLTANGLATHVPALNSPALINSFNVNSFGGIQFVENDNIDVEQSLKTIGKLYMQMKGPINSQIEFNKFEEKVASIAQKFYDISSAKKNGTKLTPDQQSRFGQHLNNFNKCVALVAKWSGMGDAAPTSQTGRNLKAFFDAVADPSANELNVCDLNANGILDTNDLLRAWAS